MKKTMLKKPSAFLLAASILVGVASAATFTDVPETNWAYSAIENMSEKGIMQGTGAGIFNPDGTITHAEFVAIVTRALIPDKVDASIKGNWYAANYKAAVDAKLITSEEMPNTAESMGRSITRYEMARILVRADESINGNVEVATDTSKIKDYENTPVKYSYFVAQAYAKGLLAGYSNGMFNGEHNMTRAQAAVVMERLINAKGEKPVEPEKPVVEPEVPMNPSHEPPSVLPAVGQYSPEYQEYLDNCGEELVTKTVRFKMIDGATKTAIPNTTMQLWRSGWDSEPSIFATLIKSDDNGEGSFTLDMPKSLYDKTMLGADGTMLCDQYAVLGMNSLLYKEADAVINGVNYKANSGALTHHFVRDNPLTMELLFRQMYR